MALEHLVDLGCHPSAPAQRVDNIQVLVRRSASDELHMKYFLNGDIPQIRIPLASTPCIGTQLWQHTCFEAFIAAPGEPGYYEFNFSPSRDWAAYRFDDYRTNMSVATLQGAPRLEVHGGDERLELTARVPLAGLALLAGEPQLRLALAAVSEAAGGRLTYWAVQHAPGKPDFHHPDGFVLELPAA